MLETSKIFKKVSIFLDNILCYSIDMYNVFSLLLQISSFSQIVQHIWFVLTLSPQTHSFSVYVGYYVYCNYWVQIDKICDRPLYILSFYKQHRPICIYMIGKFENIFLCTVSSVVFFVKKKLFYTSFYTSLYCSYIKLSIFQRNYFVFNRF